jgi:hypothetical protein
MDDFVQMTHEKVKRRALGLIAMWTAEFESDSSLGVMEDCYNSLKAKSTSRDVQYTHTLISYVTQITNSKHLKKRLRRPLTKKLVGERRKSSCKLLKCP